MKNSHFNLHNVYEGISISFTDNAGCCKSHSGHSHPRNESILEICYCSLGKIERKLKNGTTIYLGPGDFTIYTSDACVHTDTVAGDTSSVGLSIFVDTDYFNGNTIDILSGTGVNGLALKEKFCPGNSLSFFAGNEKTECIFKDFFNQPQELAHAYYKIKVTELLLYLFRLDNSGIHISEYMAAQIETIRMVHDYLAAHMSERITIEDLSKKYLMNQTTLKSLFKSVYGESIAAHMKEHRMKQAAVYLTQNQKSINEIARSVGYDSQSKFTNAFKEYYHVLPTEYRRSNHIT